MGLDVKADCHGLRSRRSHHVHMGVCGRGVRRGTLQTLLEPGVVWRSAGFATPDFARVTQGLLVPRCALG